MVMQAITRVDTRQAAGEELGVVYIGLTTSGTDTSSVVDTNIIGGTNDYIGSWIRLTSGAASGETQRVTAFDGAGDLTTNAFTATVASGTTFELWESQADPRRVDRMINTAITQRTARGVVADNDMTLHSHARTTNYAFPGSLIGISSIEYRASWVGEVLDDAQAAWTESTGASVTTSADSEDYRYGGSSMRIDYTGSADGVILTSQAITSTNISGHDYGEFWIKADTATAAGDLRLILSATASGGSETDYVDVPALVARTWTYVRVALQNPENNTAIISTALEYNANAKTNTIWLNRVKVTTDNMGNWETLQQSQWGKDNETNEFKILKDGRRSMGSSLMNVIGYRLPALPTVDTSPIELSPDLIKARVISQGKMSLVKGSATDRDNLRQDAEYWERQAGTAEVGLPLIKSGTKFA